MHTHSAWQASAPLAPFTLQVTCVCTYKMQVCISMPISIPLKHMDTYRHACRIQMKQITPSHTCSHTLPPIPQWPHTPSRPRSLTHRSGSGSKMPAGSTLIALPDRMRALGKRRGGSQPSHTPTAHARCVHQHGHACTNHAHESCTCTGAPWRMCL
jgi:hypothetical protein